MQKETAKECKVVEVHKTKVKLRRLWKYFVHIGSASVKEKIRQGKFWGDLDESEVQVLLSKLNLILSHSSDREKNTDKFIECLRAKAFLRIEMTDEEVEFLFTHYLFEILHQDYGNFVNGKDIKYTAVIYFDDAYYLLVFYKDYSTKKRIFIPQKLVQVNRWVTSCPKEKVEYVPVEEVY